MMLVTRWLDLLRILLPDLNESPWVTFVIGVLPNDFHHLAQISSLRKQTSLPARLRCMAMLDCCYNPQYWVIPVGDIESVKLLFRDRKAVAGCGCTAKS